MYLSLTPAACRAARGLLDWSQTELARRAGVSRLTVAAFESGRRKLTPNNRAALARALAEVGVRLLPAGALRVDDGRPPTESSADARRLADVIRRLQRHERRLKAEGIRRLSIFGSLTRGESRPDSDIDILVELDERKVKDILDYAGAVSVIEEIVGAKTDVAQRDRLKRHVAPSALRDEIRVF